jgi:hypothetical protein
MFDKIFTTEAEAIEAIAGDKVETCATALRTRFQDAVDSGITDLNLAAEKAVVLHAHLDHEAGLDVPEDFPFTLDDEAETHIISELLSLNQDDRAEERVDLTIPLYRRYREWGVNIFFSGTAAVSQAQREWDKQNPPPDLNEDEFLKVVDTQDFDDDLRALIHEVYTDERNAGKSVRAAALSALSTAESALFVAQLTNLFKGKDKPDLGGFLGGISN